MTPVIILRKLRITRWFEQNSNTEQGPPGCCVNRLKGMRAESGGPVKRTMAKSMVRDDGCWVKAVSVEG